MDSRKIIAVVLIVGGALGLVYGGFSYTKESHTADLGPMHVQINEKQRVNIPLWAGLGAVAAGVLILLSTRNP